MGVFLHRLSVNEQTLQDGYRRRRPAPSMMISGWIARMVYLSLHQMHLQPCTACVPPGPQSQMHWSLHGPDRPGDVCGLAVRLNVVYPEHGYPGHNTQCSRSRRRI